MKLEDKYPTLEQSKRIAELLREGAPESERRYGLNTFMYSLEEAQAIQNADEKGVNLRVSAYDLAELGEMIVKINPEYSTTVYFSLAYKRWTAGIGDYPSFPTEAQARAELLIHLLEVQQ